MTQALTQKEIETHNPFRMPAMIANALVIAGSIGLMMFAALFLWEPVVMLGLGIVGSFVSGIALFSLLMNVFTGYKQYTDVESSRRRTSWAEQEITMFFTNVFLKSALAVLTLVSSLSFFNVIPLGALPILILALIILGMIGAMALDHSEIKLMSCA
jgi:hypothetical protein